MHMLREDMMRHLAEQGIDAEVEIDGEKLVVQVKQGTIVLVPGGRTQTRGATKALRELARTLEGCLP